MANNAPEQADGPRDDAVSPAPTTRTITSAHKAPRKPVARKTVVAVAVAGLLTFASAWVAMTEIVDLGRPISPLSGAAVPRTSTTTTPPQAQPADDAATAGAAPAAPRTVAGASPAANLVAAATPAASVSSPASPAPPAPPTVITSPPTTTTTTLPPPPGCPQPVWDPEPGVWKCGSGGSSSHTVGIP